MSPAHSGWTGWSLENLSSLLVASHMSVWLYHPNPPLNEVSFIMAESDHLCPGFVYLQHKHKSWNDTEKIIMDPVRYSL